MRVSEGDAGEGARLHTGHKNSQDGARGRENSSGKLLVSGHGRLGDLLSSFLYSFSFLQREMYAGSSKAEGRLPGGVFF